MLLGIHYDRAYDHRCSVEREVALLERDGITLDQAISVLQAKLPTAPLAVKPYNPAVDESMAIVRELKPTAWRYAEPR